ALRILECGCLAGGHIALLARAFPEGEIVATDVRDDNLRKARFFLTLRQLSNVAFVREDLDEPPSLSSPNLTMPFSASVCCITCEPRQNSWRSQDGRHHFFGCGRWFAPKKKRS
ncbi:MAG TPA: class I SAM-dependent methyltransferase, partial [Chthoniobacterales bacterium]|nr:class I SAM-dependent methyltransferase [Chthoniobacterales bacterium]